ncbi:hypothetical protein H696_03441 [Fonticula alba]|uniref:NAD+ kinase n=1 Tax=Fonticula alba TaxID=691883 RepID=A0A058Z7C3_FONAL|nr:hypothetical protein H696_03441 [Fonticula alba]KCV69976.1 hypothetical protein H696_03441 [Fonticula alba]|eukprot:XP_009495582.1 hypothetical protein H696_03441 [Fonticula alba]
MSSVAQRVYSRFAHLPRRVPLRLISQVGQPVGPIPANPLSQAPDPLTFDSAAATAAGQEASVQPGPASLATPLNLTGCGMNLPSGARLEGGPICSEHIDDVNGQILSRSVSNLFSLKWSTPPRNILLIAKKGDISVTRAFSRIVRDLLRVSELSAGGPVTHGMSPSLNVRIAELLDQSSGVPHHPASGLLGALSTSLPGAADDNHPLAASGPGASPRFNIIVEDHMLEEYRRMLTPASALASACYPVPDDDYADVGHPATGSPQPGTPGQQPTQSASPTLPPNLIGYSSINRSELADVVDLVVAIGGDGTLLHVSSLFQGSPVPPVMALSMGTLGFLMPFRVDSFGSILRQALEEPVAFVPRMRLHCTIVDADGKVKDEYHALNETTLHRGNNTSPAFMDIMIDGKYMTETIADGLIIATPTGSTAYSLSAGGPVVHPSVRSLLLTPICPRSLSFRPAVLPPDCSISLRLAAGSRSSAEVSFDGRNNLKLDFRETLHVRASPFPLPALVPQKLSPSGAPVANNTDWVHDIKTLLKWNQKWGSG